MRRFYIGQCDGVVGIYDVQKMRFAQYPDARSYALELALRGLKELDKNHDHEMNMYWKSRPLESFSEWLPVDILPSKGTILVQFDGGEYLSFTETERRTDSSHIRYIQRDGVRWKFLYEEDQVPTPKKYKIRSDLEVTAYHKFDGDVCKANKFLEEHGSEQRVEKCCQVYRFNEGTIKEGDVIVLTKIGDDEWCEHMDQETFDSWFEEVK